MLKLGLDIGGSTTKVVGFEDEKIVGTTLVTAGDPVTAAYGAVGRFLHDEEKSLSDIASLHATGVGLSFLDETLHDIPIQPVDEFTALAVGARFLSQTASCLAVSVGTGTTFVAARPEGAKHIIGSGVGGGTLLGLSYAMLETRDWNMIDALAMQGDYQAVDLTIQDLSQKPIPGLTAEATAANFGKLNDSSRREDLAAAIVNMVYQTVGIIAVSSARQEKLSPIVFTGNASLLKSAQRTLNAVSELYDYPFVFPKLAAYATAIGAVHA